MRVTTEQWKEAFSVWCKIWDRSEPVKFSEVSTGRPVLKAEAEDADGKMFEYEYNLETKEWELKTCRMD